MANISLVTHHARAPGTALIVGAGIGGLSAALALGKAGWRVRVFERASNPREHGFGLLLAPNAMRALRQLGLADAVSAGGFVATVGEVRRADGRVLKRLDASVVTASLGEPTVCVLRPVLHGLLLEAVGPDALELDATAESVTEQAGTVTLRLKGERTATGEVLIGADGVGSVVRQYLHPAEAAPRRSRFVALRGVSHNVDHHLGAAGGAQYLGRGIEAGVTRAGGGAVYWYISAPSAAIASGAGEPSRLAATLVQRFEPSLRAIIGATAPGDLRVDELLERDPLPHWGAGAVTLLGDAAHPMLPHAGQGAAQALEDAVALGRALGVDRPISTSLRRYEQVRAARTRTVVQLARRNARMGAIESRVGCWLRDVAVRLVPTAIVARSLVALGHPPDESP